MSAVLRAAAARLGELRGALEQARVQIEHIARIRFAGGGTAHKQGNLSIRPGVLGEIVVDAQRVPHARPGELHAVVYKDGKEWAADTVKTTGAPGRLLLKPDRATIAGDGRDLSFVTLTVADEAGSMVPRSKNLIHFEISGPGEIVATDNGDPTDFTVFSSKDRKAFNGLALVIVRAKRGQMGTITVTAASDGLARATAVIAAR
mgnify:CR=1 FL=1